MKFKKLIDERVAARVAKDCAKTDDLRDELGELGVDMRLKIKCGDSLCKIAATTFMYLWFVDAI